MRLRSLLCTIALSSALSGASAASATHPGSLVLFLSGEQVQKELRVTPLQAVVLDSLKSEYQEQIGELFKSTDDTNPDAKFTKLNASFNKRALSTLSTRQKKELPRIEHSALKGWMLTLPHVQQELGLSEKQISRITRLQEKLDRENQKQHDRVNKGKISNARRLSILREKRLDASERMESLLTPDQLQSFLKLREK